MSGRLKPKSNEYIPTPAPPKVPEFLPAKEKLIECLARGMTDIECANATGIDIKDIYRYQRNWEFRRLVDECRTILFEGIHGKYLAMAEESAATVRHVMLYGRRDSVRLNAAKMIINTTMQMRQSLSVEPRLAAIEAEFAKNAEDARRVIENHVPVNGKPTPNPVKLVYPDDRK